MKSKVETPNAPKPLPQLGYSQAIVADNMVFVAGQIHLTPDGKLLEGTIEEQTHQVMKNLQAILEAADCTFENVVKTTAFITDMSSYGKVIEAYKSYMKEPYPARETVCVKALPAGASVEISMIAIK